MGSTNSKRPATSEEMKYLSPTGLYPSCNWDLKTIRKLIIEKKLAPFYPGREEKDSPELDECPICFMVRSMRHAPHASRSPFSSYVGVA
jgi:hypothetical protein